MIIDTIHIGDVFKDKKGNLKIVLLSNKQLFLADLNLVFPEEYDDFGNLMRSGEWELVGNCQLREHLKLSCK